MIATSAHLTLSLPETAKRYLIFRMAILVPDRMGEQRPSDVTHRAQQHALHRKPIPFTPKSTNQTDPGTAQSNSGKESVSFWAHWAWKATWYLDGLSLTGTYETGSGDWFIAHGDENEIMPAIRRTAMRKTGYEAIKSQPASVVFVVQLYTEINERRLLKMLGDLGGRENSQIACPSMYSRSMTDGRYSIGDWEANRNFRPGWKSLATRINETGRKAGLWLAPLLVVPSIEDLPGAQRMDLAMTKTGNPSDAGFNWGEKLYALDTSHPEVLELAKQLDEKNPGLGVRLCQTRLPLCRSTARKAHDRDAAGECLPQWTENHSGCIGRCLPADLRCANPAINRAV